MTTKTAPKGGLMETVTLPHTEELELYHNAFSSCSQKVRLCLAEAGQAYKSNHIHLVETGWYQTCSPQFKKINPGATVKRTQTRTHARTHACACTHALESR